MKSRQVQIWVHPDFAKTIKVNASLEGLKIIDYTKKISENLDVLTQKKKKLSEDLEFKHEKYKFGF